MLAYCQGRVDFFCGVYAIINSVRAAAGNYHRFSYKEGCLFYQHMMEYLYNRGVFCEVLHRGTTHELMQDLLKEAADYLLNTCNLQLHYRRPFLNEDVSLLHATDILGSFLNKAHSSAIVRFHNDDIGDHWSVIVKKTLIGHKLKLFDSYFYPFLDIKKSTWAPYKKDGLTHIAKEGIIFIRISRAIKCVK